MVQIEWGEGSMTVHKLTWEDCGAKIDEQVIELIEAKLKHRFPQDFRAVILECHGTSETCMFQLL